jgi:hypothetical protein
MNVPVFVNQHIVLVAGVGNKVSDYNENDIQQLTLLMEGMRRLIDRKHAEEELTLYHEHLEDLVTRQTADLTAGNHELEAFSYSFLHDLVLHCELWMVLVKHCYQTIKKNWMIRGNII